MNKTRFANKAGPGDGGEMTDTSMAMWAEKVIEHDENDDCLFYPPAPAKKPATKRLIAFGIAAKGESFFVVDENSPLGELEFMEKTLAELRATYAPPEASSMTCAQANALGMALIHERYSL